jgi:NADPH-dependent ferric siderophore reductase
MTSVDYSIPPVRHRIAITATVTKVRRLSPLMQRLTFKASEFVGQEAISCADTYMKIVLPDPTNSDEPVMRSYTVRSHDSVAGTVDIDFALHGQGGVAAPWAERAQVGDTAEFKGIGGGYNPSEQAPWHLLIGDDSALPAIAAAVEQLGEDSGKVVILIADSPEELLGDGDAFSPPEGSEVQVVSHTPAVIEAVRSAYASHEGVPHVFLHGEASMVREVRRVIRSDFAQDLKAMSVSGYWRAGASDEQWREMKRDWSRGVEADEAKLAGVSTSQRRTPMAACHK